MQIVWEIGANELKQFLKLDHVQIAAPPDCEVAARRFYGEIIGLPEVPKPPVLRSRGGVWFQVSGEQLHIGVEQDFQPARKAHPAFATENLNDMATRLQNAGYEITWDEALPEARRFYVNDPWGNRVEFLETEKR
jgi:catechol-2,3-dioxygenase